MIEILVAVAAAFLSMAFITMGFLATGHAPNGPLRFFIFAAAFVVALFALGVL